MSAPQRSTGRRVVNTSEITISVASPSDPSGSPRTAAPGDVASADSPVGEGRRRRGRRGRKNRRPVRAKGGREGAGRPASGRDEPPDGPHPVEVAGLLHELSARLLSADDLKQALDRLAVFAASAVPGTLRCSVALIGEGGPLTLAASGPRAQALDDVQYASGDGPGLEAARTRAVVSVDDLPGDTRWPELAECAGEEGVHGVVSIPVDVQRSAVGSVSFFVGPPGGVGAERLLTAMALVNQAEILLGEMCRREGLSQGAIVDRAAGVIIAQRGCGVREAYDVLRDTAQRLGMPWEDVAERLIAAAARNADA
ncbi:GAF and ANTAR domain-containing protein [Actinoplanes sp. NPDC049316]|uniref:GAF and ANTAR domain-containing protein n=1 Tax=Actinoplanes sp. NPDC049316 TaxID=3154727 RepID=UPI00342E6031